MLVQWLSAQHPIPLPWGIISSLTTYRALIKLSSKRVMWPKSNQEYLSELTIVWPKRQIQQGKILYLKPTERDHTAGMKEAWAWLPNILPHVEKWKYHTGSETGDVRTITAGTPELRPAKMLPRMCTISWTQEFDKILHFSLQTKSKEFLPSKYDKFFSSKLSPSLLIELESSVRCSIMLCVIWTFPWFSDGILHRMPRFLYKLKTRLLGDEKSESIKPRQISYLNELQPTYGKRGKEFNYINTKLKMF